jgi:hypothetical protein
MTSVAAPPSWPCLLAASGGLWLSGHLLPVAKRVRRRRVVLAVLWVGEQCGHFAAYAAGRDQPQIDGSLTIACLS